ncbi:ABC transporter permease [Neogemmobacter tilapiae]|uniref:ABC transporter n=1 Tax=Neogemmobacter tilapiae TaxID=875041 RepID=A0A918TSC5_9RHOB|nr:ABC transporter permease subunit [Gemmobacter tilapiae]GHC61119.1 ABC transporter [Gemmobacter tilapiae]
MWALLPALLVLAGLSGGGLALALGRVGWADWAAVLPDGRVWAALGFSLWIALASSLLAAVLGLALAMLLRQSFRGRRVVGGMVAASLTLPHAVVAVGMLFLLSQSGWLSRLAFALGLTDAPADFPALTHDGWGLGIILHYAWKEAPFVALVLLAALRGRIVEQEQAARSLGAGAWGAFRHVTLPALAPALLGASVITFGFALGAYEVPLILGTHDPQALPVLAWQAFADADLTRQPQAVAMALLLTGAAAALLLPLLFWLARGTP